MNQLSVIGLAAMGKNLAKNFASRGFQVGVFNRSFNRTLDLLDEKNENIQGYEDLKSLVLSLETPRKIFLMVKSGEAVEDTIKQLRMILDRGDILIDCGNSHWKETMKKQEELGDVGLEFIGCGVSGGWEGALLGPSIMPGGKKSVVEEVLPYLQAAAADDFGGGKCVTNVGTGPAGHYVKMVHNGIEYSIMQGIAEVYDILLNFGYDQSEILDFFQGINTGDNKSFLLDITEEILKSKDNLNGEFLLTQIDSRAGAKGTGKWTVEEGMNLGVAVPNIYAGLNARVMTEVNYRVKEYKDKEFVTSQNQNTLPKENITKEELKNLLNKVVAAFYLISYQQGLELILAANKEYKLDINILEVLRIWQGGCIIRSKMLLTISEHYKQGKYPQELYNEAKNSIAELSNLLLNNKIIVPLPVINSTQDYILAMESQKLPQNLTQAQRDFFGAHTYERIDRAGNFTGGWNNDLV
jgi:6-phosphogluconate dehydrogenase